MEEIKYYYSIHEIPLLIDLTEQEEIELLTLNAKGASEGITEDEIKRLKYLCDKGVNFDGDS